VQNTDDGHGGLGDPALPDRDLPNGSTFRALNHLSSETFQSVFGSEASPRGGKVGALLRASRHP
jgi:hypothetical protein